jgi:hypothetical protein
MKLENIKFNESTFREVFNKIGLAIPKNSKFHESIEVPNKMNSGTDLINLMKIKSKQKNPNISNIQSLRLYYINSEDIDESDYELINSINFKFIGEVSSIDSELNISKFDKYYKLECKHDKDIFYIICQ